MTDDGLYKLMTWLSPSFPVGAYAFSHGIERACELELVHDSDSTAAWIATLLASGSGQTDLALFCLAYDAFGDDEQLADVIATAASLFPSAELSTESLAQGEAFIHTLLTCWPAPGLDVLADEDRVAYPVAVAVAAAAHGIDRASALLAFAHAFSANLVSAAIRLVPLGQTDGQHITAMLAERMPDALSRANATTLDSVASATLISDICSMQHEHQYTRLFRS
ncbi:MAG: urease accessory UreF family protein [Pseudomonadota bacterium]